MPPAYKMRRKEPCNQKHCYWMLDLDFAVSRYLRSNVRSVLRSTVQRRHRPQHSFSTFTRYIISVLRDGRGRIVTENAHRNSPRFTMLYAAFERGSKPK
jgi:hypothetical protein